jgi:hypothetical protein
MLPEVQFWFGQENPPPWAANAAAERRIENRSKSDGRTGVARRGAWMRDKLAEQNLGHERLGYSEQILVGRGSAHGLGNGSGH